VSASRHGAANLINGGAGAIGGAIGGAASAPALANFRPVRRIHAWGEG